jgi:murein DD-endopeptidase MepM/ murein hydrolase activator NlpD
MRRVLVLLPLSFLLAACAESRLTPSPVPAWLPWPSATPSLAVTPLLPTSAPPATLTPTATPTPVTYVIKKGDTLGGIAYSFGISVDALQAANPKVLPTFLSIGTVLTIPVTAASLAPQAVALASPTPWPVTLAAGPVCYPQVTGALYCFVEARNPGSAGLQNVAVQLVLVGPKGEALASEPAYSALELIPPGGAAPVAALFRSVPPGMVAPVAQVLSAETVPTAASTVALQIPAHTGAASQGAGSLWTVTGQVRNASTAAVSAAKLVLTLYGRDGKILNYRQETLAGDLAAGAVHDFSISANSLGGAVDRYSVVAEGKP